MTRPGLPGGSQVWGERVLPSQLVGPASPGVERVRWLREVVKEQEQVGQQVEERCWDEEREGLERL